MKAPDFCVADYFPNAGAAADGFSPEKRTPAEHFAVDDLFDFSNQDMVVTDEFFEGNVAANSTDSSTVTAAVDGYSCNSSFSGALAVSSAHLHPRSFSADSHFSGEFCVPYDELAQLEWLSNFVEDSFLSDQTGLQVLSGSKPPTPDSSSSSCSTRLDHHAARSPAAHIFDPETPLPGKARSKRTRAAPCDWSTRLLKLSSPSKKPESPMAEASGRKCLHCGAEKTPQWRTGPMGPKTLCNACGVRYKSGRLVPEYRPAASPTFVATKHSNSHRKVLELRRQRELRQQQQQHPLSQNSIFGRSDIGDAQFLIHHHVGPEFRHMI